MMEYDPVEIPLAGSPVDRPQVEATEIARLWLVDGQPAVLIGRRLWEKPEMWGMLISSFIHDVANAYQTEGFDRRSVIGKIATTLAVEMKNKTTSAGKQ